MPRRINESKIDLKCRNCDERAKASRKWCAYIFLSKTLLENANEQERKIIALLSEGYSQSEIAQKLGVSQSTVSRKISKFKQFLSAAE